MTRQEQIEKEAKNHSADVLDRHWFKRGAEWADAHPAWVSVEAKLPEPWMVGAYSSDYVIAYDGDDLLFAYYDFSQKEWHGANYEKLLIEPTHWMPLPASPATKGGEV